MLNKLLSASILAVLSSGAFASVNVIPEPSTYALLGIGIAAAAFAAKRKSK